MRATPQPSFGDRHSGLSRAGSPRPIGTLLLAMVRRLTLGKFISIVATLASICGAYGYEMVRLEQQVGALSALRTDVPTSQTATNPVATPAARGAIDPMDVALQRLHPLSSFGKPYRDDLPICEINLSYPWDSDGFNFVPYSDYPLLVTDLSTGAQTWCLTMGDLRNSGNRSVMLVVSAVVLQRLGVSTSGRFLHAEVSSYGQWRVNQEVLQVLRAENVIEGRDFERTTK